MVRGRATLCGVVVLAAFAVATCSRPQALEQPIQFSHKKHIDSDVECVDCHEHFESATFSGLPSTELCMGCHEDDTSSDAEMSKLLAYAADEQNVPWKRVYQVADHVFYSHRRHVAVASLTCAGCHGAIAELNAPPARPLVDQTMDWCLHCHEAEGATTDCIHCHR